MGKKPKITPINGKRLEEYKPGASRKEVIESIKRVANTANLMENR